MCFPNLGISIICKGSKTPFALASSAVLYSHLFFKPDCAIKSAALLFAIAEIISAVVKLTEAFIFFSGPNNFCITSGNSSPVFIIFILPNFKILDISFICLNGFFPSALAVSNTDSTIILPYSLNLASSEFIFACLVKAVFLSILFFLITFLTTQSTALLNTFSSGT